MQRHILFVLDYYPPHRGWAETVFEHITKKLFDKWYKITVITSRFSPSLPVYENMEWIEVYRTGSSRLSFMWHAIFSWWKICREHTIDFIHTSTYGWAIPAWIIGLFCRKKIVITVHEVFWSLWSIYKSWPKSYLYRLFEWFIFQLPYTAYHVVSTYTLNSIRSIYWISDTLIRLVYNWVDSDFWSGNAVSKKEIKELRKKYWWADRFVLLYYGHSGKSKWLDYLIDALPAIFNEYPDLLFVCNLIHAKRDRETKDKLHSLWYTKNIQVFSWFSLSSLRTLIASSDCVVAPSLSEWFGSVHAEVSSIGKPLITTYVASIPEVVSWNVVFVQPQSSQAIVDGVKKMQNNDYPQLQSKSFPWSATILWIEEIYDTFIYF